MKWVKKKKFKDIIKLRNYSPEDHIWMRGYNQAIDTCSEVIKVKASMDEILNVLVNKLSWKEYLSIPSHRLKDLATAISKMILEGIIDDQAKR